MDSEGGSHRSYYLSKGLTLQSFLFLQYFFIGLNCVEHTKLAPMQTIEKHIENGNKLDKIGYCHKTERMK